MTCAAALIAAMAVAACGGAKTSGPSAGGGGGGSSGPETGKQIFSSVGCASCHTLAAAGSSGTIGPNLDELRPTDAAVITQVTNGGGGMPSFGHTLSTAQIVAVAKFVSTSTHGGTP